MNSKQEGALNAVRRYLLNADKNIIEEDIAEVNDKVFVTIATCLEKEPSPVARIICGHCYRFTIGVNGGYFKYSRKFRKNYFKIHELLDICSY